MDYSNHYEDDATVKEIEKAQRTLEDVESKMKKFRSRKREKSQSTVNKAPFPDLNKYFSYLTNEFQNEEDGEELLLQNDPRSKKQSKQVITQSVYNISKPPPPPAPEQKENNSMTINQKLEKEKNSSINKIEQYYIERNEILQEKIRELKLIKEKIIKDQKLLLRNNEELEDFLQRERNQREEATKINELKEKIEKMQEKISGVQTQNSRIALRKKDLEKHIKQVLRTQKESLSQEMLFRPKSSSAVVRCQYH